MADINDRGPRTASRSSPSSTGRRIHLRPGAFDRGAEQPRGGHHHGVRRLSTQRSIPRRSTRARRRHRRPEGRPPRRGRRIRPSRGGCAIAHERTVRWLERCREGAWHARTSRRCSGSSRGGRTWISGRRRSDAICNIRSAGLCDRRRRGGGGAGVDRDAWSSFAAPAVAPGIEAALSDGRGVRAGHAHGRAVRSGVDMFDCVLPTRNGRNGYAFTPSGPSSSEKRSLRGGRRCLDPRAGLRLPRLRGWPGFSAREPGLYPAPVHGRRRCSGPTLVSLHNIRHFHRLLLDIRRAIRERCLVFTRAEPGLSLLPRSTGRQPPPGIPNNALVGSTRILRKRPADRCLDHGLIPCTRCLRIHPGLRRPALPIGGGPDSGRGRLAVLPAQAATPGAAGRRPESARRLVHVHHARSCSRS